MRRVKSHIDDYETFFWYIVHQICFHFRAQLFILHRDDTSYTEKRTFTDSSFFLEKTGKIDMKGKKNSLGLT